MEERPRESSTQAVPDAWYPSSASNSGKITDPLIMINGSGGCSETIDTVPDTTKEPCAAPENCSLSELENLESMSGTDYIDQRQPEVILIVGNKSKTGVVELLTQADACNWDDDDYAGVRLLRHKSNARVIVDTTPLGYVNGKSSAAMARRWISRNSLRRIIVGKLVVVVCVITCSAVVDDRCNGAFLSNANCWVDVCQLIFRDYNKGGIMILVNTHNGDLPNEGMKKIRSFVEDHQFMKKNIIYSGDGSVATFLDECLGRGKIIRASKEKKVSAWLKKVRSCFNKKEPNFTKPSIRIMPFLMKEVSAGFGPWGPERVLLFGKTGNGKSTLAQMLTLGDLDPKSPVFTYSNGLRGGTRGIEYGQGRGWYVVDTPGFGEPKDPNSTIPTGEVNRQIQRYVRLVEGTFSHYLFVVKKDRVDGLDWRLWKFFKKLFGEEISQQFSVVVSNADNDWLDKNIDHLKKSFDGCRSFLCAEFPSAAKENDEELQVEEKDVRMESLEQLEKELAKLGRCDRHFYNGKHAKVNKIEQRERAYADSGIERDPRISMINNAANVILELTDLASRLLAILTVNDKITLLPFDDC